MSFNSSLIVALVLLLSGNVLHAQQQLPTKFEQSKGLETVTYHEGIAWFQSLAKQYPTIEMQAIGDTDSGFPLHFVVFSTEREFNVPAIKKKNKSIILINNAIHPGEPDGVDASMLLLRNLATDKELQKRYQNVVVVVIPFYNIGGALNRNGVTRVNQNGPREYGFRGNAQNLDLNRDFIKLDSKNAKTFTEIYHHFDPDVFIDNHVSNGADYQHVMTMLETQPDKLGGPLGSYLKNKMMPDLNKKMDDAKFPMVPYVNVYNTTPDAGYNQFLDGPRYSSGYTTLFHTIGFVPETHMLKPYKQRVEATLAFLNAILQFVAEDGEKIKELRKSAKDAVKEQKEFTIDWQLDTASFDEIPFKGYEGKKITSQLTGHTRLFYDRNKPFDKDIPFYNSYIPLKTVLKPKAYIIPKGWHHVIDRLKLNKVALEAIKEDTIINVEAYYIEGYKTVEKPYEGHYLHYETKVEKKKMPVKFLKGDYIIYTNQSANRYLVETLEPEAPDSFFNWNFFDAILQQKEGFSDYVFEDLALEILEKDKELKSRFEKKKNNEPDFADDPQAQLKFIYENSPHYEEVYMRYPIFRYTDD